MVVPDDKLQDIVLFDKNFYFEKLSISDEKVVKMSSSHEENFIRNKVKENYIVKIVMVNLNLSLIVLNIIN